MRFVEFAAAANLGLVGIHQDDRGWGESFEHAWREPGQITAGSRLDGAVSVEQDVLRALGNAFGGTPLHLFLDVRREIAHFIPILDQFGLLTKLQHLGAEGDNGVIEVRLDPLPGLEQQGGFPRARHARDNDDSAHSSILGCLFQT